MDKLDQKAVSNDNFAQGMAKLHIADLRGVHELQFGALAFATVIPDEQYAKLPADYIARQIGQGGFEAGKLETSLMNLGVE